MGYHKKYNILFCFCNFKYRPQMSCSGTNMELGKEYVISLEPSYIEIPGMFDLYEGVTLGSAAYEVEVSVLQERHVLQKHVS